MISTFDRWINAQRIAFAAYRVNLPLSKTMAHEPREYRLILEQSLLSPGYGIRSQHIINNLPPTTLELLLDIDAKNIHRRLRDLRPSWQQALQRLTAEKEEEMNLLRRTTFFAHLIMLGPTRPLFMSRLGNRSLSQWWSMIIRGAQKLEIEKEFATLCAALRNPTLETARKIEAIEIFREALLCIINRTPNLWPHVENVLYHHLFCWPLLVLSGGAAPPAFSLPVAVDVYFDGNGSDNDPSIHGDDDQVIKVAPWREHLRTSITAAKQLWYSQHRHYGPFCEKVMTSSIVFDFTYARRILGEVETLPSDYPIELGQGSMEAYFTQIILSRFLGYPIIPGHVATGALGSMTAHPSNQIVDYQVNWPVGVREKITYVYKSHLFQRVVIPTLPQEEREKNLFEDFLRSYRHIQNVEIVYAPYLRRFTDMLQPGTWRRNQFIRCPDVAWALDNAGHGLPEVTSEKVQRCLIALQRNASAVLRLSDDLSVLDVASALRHLDESRYSKYYPLLSCAFLRITQEEYNQRFWYVLWSLFGAPSEVQQQFYDSSTAHLAADHLVAALNHFSPSEINPRFRAPDMLVIIGTDAWDDRLPSGHELSEPLNFSLVMDELKARTDILPVLDADTTQFYSRTRIIIVPFDRPLEKPAEGELNLKDQKLIEQLSIFRFGFTQTMVAPMLWQQGFHGEEVRRKLRSLVTTGQLHYTHGTRMYYMPGYVGFDSTSRGSGFTKVLQHYHAALTYAPYLNNKHQTAINFYLAHQPHIVHEAQYHLERAKRYIQADQMPKEARNLHGRIIRGILNTTQFYDTQGWHTVARLLDSDLPSEDAHQLATEMIKDADRTGITLRPRCGTDAAQAAYQVWRRRIEIYGRFDPAVEEMRAVVVDRYEAALQACTAFPSQWRANRVMVLTRYGDFLLQDARDDDEQIRLSKINHEAWELIQEYGAMGVAHAPWFERFGDWQTNHSEAATIYAHGVLSVPRWYTAWIKWVGASCCMSREDAKQVLEILKTLEEGKLYKDFCLRSRGVYNYLTSQQLLVHLKIRIEKGYQLLTSSVDRRNFVR
jgi:hypothetical protein